MYFLSHPSFDPCFFIFETACSRFRVPWYHVLFSSILLRTVAGEKAPGFFFTVLEISSPISFFTRCTSAGSEITRLLTPEKSTAALFSTVSLTISSEDRYLVKRINDFHGLIQCQIQNYFNSRSKRSIWFAW